MTETQHTTQPLDAAALDKLEALAKAATRGPWKRSERLNGPFWHISSEYTIDGEPCKSGRQAIGAIHGESKHGAPKYAAMFEANASFIAEANPQTILALIAQARAAQPAQTLDEAHLKQLVLDVSNASYFCGTDPERDGPAYAEKLDKAASAEAALIQYVQTIVRAAQAHHAAATTQQERSARAEGNACIQYMRNGDVKSWQQRAWEDGCDTELQPDPRHYTDEMQEEIVDLRAELARRCRAQGGNTNDSNSGTAATKCEAKPGEDARDSALEQAAREVEKRFIGYRDDDADLREIALSIRSLKSAPNAIQNNEGITNV